MGVFTTRDATLVTDDFPERVRVTRVSEPLLPLLGVSPLEGRLFTPDEDTPGGGRSVLIGYGFWQRHFGGAAGVVGQATRSRWRTSHDRRHHAEHVCVPSPDCSRRHRIHRKHRALGASRHRLRGRAARRALLDDGRSATPRRLRRDGPDRDEHDSGASRGRLSGQPARVVRCSGTARGASRRGCPTGAPRVARIRGLRAPHRLRQRREPPPHSRHRPGTRDGDTSIPRSEPFPAHPPARHREPPPCPHGRCLGARPRLRKHLAIESGRSR